MHLTPITMLAAVIAGATAQNQIGAWAGPFENPSCKGDVLAHQNRANVGYEDYEECVKMSGQATCFQYIAPETWPPAFTASNGTEVPAGGLPSWCHFQDFEDEACADQVVFMKDMKGTNIMETPPVRSFKWGCQFAFENEDGTVTY